MRNSKPIIVLVSICVIAGAALGGVNMLTSEAIAQNEEESAMAIYREIAPDATGFTEIGSDVEGVTACLKAEGCGGYVIVAQSKGYGGEVPIAVYFGPDGSIVSLSALSNSETPGLGTKIAEPDFIDQFIGRGDAEIATDDFDAITGATISSKAALAAINEAISAHEAIEGRE
ncbi:MAG: FMN-binding protein [Eggerthellaceae bacterium]|jgi:electron transport complex protein RnfG